MATDAAKHGAGLVGIGAAACAACCAGPIIGVLAAAGFVTALAYVTVGLIGLAHRRAAGRRDPPTASPAHDVP